MANEVKLKEGTAFTLNSSSTPVYAPTSLASGGGYVSGVKDLGSTFARQYRIQIRMDFATAPTLGRYVELWAVYCDDGSGTNPDMGVTLNSTIANATVRLGFQFIGVAVAQANTNNQYDTISAPFVPKGRYVAFCVYNDTNQAFSSTATDHQLVITPISDEIQ